MVFKSRAAKSLNVTQASPTEVSCVCVHQLEVERALLEAECGDVEGEVERLEAGLLQLTQRSNSMEDRHSRDRQHDEQDLQVSACTLRVSGGFLNLRVGARMTCRYGPS